MLRFLLLTVALLASPIFAENESVTDKKIDKRGLLGLGYGGYHGGLHNDIGVYGHHGYLNGHGAHLVDNHGIIPSYHNGYTLPAGYNSHGYVGYTAPRFNTYHHGIGHGLNYWNGW